VITALIVLALSIGAVAATLRWLRPRGPVSPRDQVDAFTRARAMTTRWSADPGATPGPVKEFLRQQSQHEREDSLS
jgi:hypothetical protein